MISCNFVSKYYKVSIESACHSLKSSRKKREAIVKELYPTIKELNAAGT